MLLDLYQLLSRQQAQQKVIRGPEDLLIARTSPILSVALQDSYQQEEPVEVRAWLSNNEPTEGLIGQIEAVGSACDILEMPFQTDGDGWRLSVTDLASGLYRLTVSPSKTGRDSPSAVHDLFEVAL